MWVCRPINQNESQRYGYENIKYPSVGWHPENEIYLPVGSSQIETLNHDQYQVANPICHLRNKYLRHNGDGAHGDKRRP